MENTAFDRLVEFFGSQAEMTRQIREATGEPLTTQAISSWNVKGIPANRCAMLERLVRRRVRCYEMRPDVFPAPIRRKAKADTQSATATTGA